MSKLTKQNFEKVTSMAAYGLAAGALGAISLPVAAAEQAISGLPLLVNDVTETVGIDVDGDAVNDFNVFKFADYGGGFAIGTINTGDSSHAVLARDIQVPNDRYLGYVQRNDSGEYSNETGYLSTPISLYRRGTEDDYSGGYKLVIDAMGLEKSYLPFRGKPGFISLVWRGDSTTGNVTLLQPHIAYLEVVVSNDGSQLSILSGAWQEGDYDDYIRLPEVTPPPASALAELALGAK